MNQQQPLFFSFNFIIISNCQLLMSRLSPFRKITNPNKKELSPLTSSFQSNYNNFNDKYRHTRQTPVDNNKGKYYHEETHNTYKPTEKKKNENLQIQNMIQKNRFLNAQNAQLYQMLEETGQIVTTLQKKLQEQIYREVKTLQAIQIEKNKFIVETQKKFKDYQSKIQQLIKEIYLLKEEKYQSNIIKAKEIDLIKQSLNKQQLLRLQQFANGQMTAREATQLEHNKVKQMLSLQKNEMQQLAFEYRNTTDKLKNEIITLNNEILHINHLRKIELSQQKMQYQNMIENILKQSAKEKELINVEHDIAIKKLEQQLSSKNFENNKITELKKIGQIEQNVRQNQLLEKKSKLEDQLKQLQYFYKKKNFQEAENLKLINRLEVNAVSHGNESLISNLKAEIHKLVNLNQTKSQQIQNLYTELETQRNLNNQQVKTLQNFIDQLKHRAKEVQRTHILQEEQLKIKWAQLSQANLITFKQFYEHELQVMSQQLQQKANLADNNRQKLHHELQDKNEMKKRFDLQCLKLNTRIAELQLQISQLIVAKKEQTGFFSMNMQLTSEKLIQHTRDREKLSANNQEDKKRLQELILAKDKQIEQLNNKIHFLRENYSKEIAQKNAQLQIIKKHKEDVDIQLRKEKLFYENEISRKDILIKYHKESFDHQISHLKRNLKQQYDQLDKETSQKINKLQIDLKQMKAIQKNLKSEIATITNQHKTETVQNKNELVNEKERMSRQKRENQERLTKFYKDQVQKQKRQIQDLTKQLTYKEQDLRRMADKYFFLQQKMAAVIQSQDKLRVIETQILSLGQQNNVVKNFAEIVKSKLSYKDKQLLNANDIQSYNHFDIMFSSKEAAEVKEQIKRQILDLDHQIHQLETFYLQDTKEAGNLIKGFDNYISLKTSKIQAAQRKQKVQNYERIFSLSSIISKTSLTLVDSLMGDSLARLDIQANSTKRNNRPRQGGKTKSGGKNLFKEDNIDEEQSSQSGDREGGDDSLQDSLGKSRGTNKKKKINKVPIRKN